MEAMSSNQPPVSHMSTAPAFGAEWVAEPCPIFGELVEIYSMRIDSYHCCYVTARVTDSMASIQISDSASRAASVSGCNQRHTTILSATQQTTTTRDFLAVATSENGPSPHNNSSSSGSNDKRISGLDTSGNYVRVVLTFL